MNQPNMLFNQKVMNNIKYTYIWQIEDKIY